MKTKSIVVLFITMSSAHSGYAAQTCGTEQTAISALSNKYSAAFASYQDESQSDQSKTNASASFDVKWADTEMIFDTPTITIRQQKLIFGVPQVTMKTRDITFGTPSVRTKTIKTGQYPEFFCDTHTVIPSCTVKWSDISADIPEPFLEQQHIKLDIPEFTFGDVTILMGVPEFSMQRQRWVVGLPQFTLKNINVTTSTGGENTPDPSSDESLGSEASLQQRVTQTKASAYGDLVTATNNLYACFRGDVQRQSSSVRAQYNTSIDELTSVIANLTARGADPSLLPNSDGTTSDLVSMRQKTIAAREAALASLDSALEGLAASERQTVANIR
ncbi:hypothetical protein UP10_01245 [Bradyrhizobium sp. LTSPM299]|uniref:hypothetical protein n=1 Tax=Bradyrhizobium sp. LTSPM299 TaxID=1619233 RepID=UPI0005C93DC7|nr:hypothetical protein [Bradyrhizobium sp. LTSPM299]KJC62043.1 hypothetical protein UP10_01245 [Bradyrhizobium sp. LTSPM299]